MDKFNKKIVMFYRGKDNSNKISSSTQNTLSKCRDVFDIDFINLDKRNYDKYFTKSGCEIDITYVWHDEELLIDYIKEKYPNIELRIYDDNNSVIINSGRIKHIIAQNIINEYKATFGYINLWRINGSEQGIIDVKMFKVDYESNTQCEKNKYYTSKGLAKEALKLRIKSEIKQSEDMIKYYETKINNYKNKLKTL